MVPADFNPPLRTHLVRIGSLSKETLLTRLQAARVQLNEAAHVLFADSRFTTQVVSSLVQAIEVTPNDLGFPDGATYKEIVERASTRGLLLCPLELGPHLRLHFPDQLEGFVGQPASQNRAPPGSITVASAPIANDEETPKGFYLRRIEGALWLRGYRSWPGHNWSPQDVLVFSRPINAA
jgi:hypothetical protein